MTPIQDSVRTFLEAAGQTTTIFNIPQQILYLALQCEELGEKLGVLLDTPMGQVEGLATKIMYACATALHDLEQRLKHHPTGFTELFEDAERSELLDADIDLVWVTIGAAYSAGADVTGAMAEITRANMSKGTPWPTGLTFTKDATGKITKPEGWTPPNLAPFVCGGSAE